MKFQLYKFLSGGVGKVLYTFALTLIFLLPTISARADGGDRIPYAVFDATTGTLTFKYDTQKPNGAFEIKENEYPDWCSSAPDIKKVKFEESFAEFTPTSCAYWLDSCYNLTEIIDMDKYLKTENVINMDKMFYYCSSLKSINLSGFNTTKVEYMYSLFAGCANLATIYVGNNWKTDNVKSSYDMFYGCEMLYGEKGTECVSGNVDASFAHIDKGTSDPGYFTQYGNTPYTPIINYDEKQPYAVVDNGVLTFYCNNKRPANSFSMPKFDRISWSNLAGQFTKVKFDESFNDYTPTDLNYWFYSCTNLSSIDGTENLNTSEVNSMLRMFYNCSSLKNLDLHSLNTTKVETLSDMFVGCESLETLDLSGFNTNNLKWMGYMFCNCRNLATIYVGNNWNTDNVEESFDMFSGCDVLVGGNGTTFDVNYTDATYARIDDPEHGKPGYFTPNGESIPPALVDGAYQITSAVDLLWFANYVNSGNPNANAKLCADIVLNDNLLSKIKNGETENLVTWIPIGTAQNPYKGTFTPNNYSISGLYVNDSKLNYVGLFGYYASDIYMTYGNYISVKDSYFAGYDYVGGLFGYVNSEKVRLSDFYFRGEVSGNSNVGGLFGKIDGFESISRGYVSAKVTGSSNVGSVCGYLDGKTENNYFNNLYYDTQLCTLGAINGTDDAENIIIGKNTFHTGEVANIAGFRQDLSNPSSFPEFKGQHVHKNLSGSGYHNPVYQDNHCTKCINYTYELPQLVNGVYQISNADELYGFMHLVNTGNNTIDAVLTDDIVVNEKVLENVHSGNTEKLREWYSIGEGNANVGFYERNYPYYGVFDGKLFTISGLYFDSKIDGEDQAGLFAFVLGTVKNVIVKDSYFKKELGGIAGISLYLGNNEDETVDPVIENCIFDGEIYSSSCSGICGCALNGRAVIKNCINLGKISGNSNSTSGILGVDFGSHASVINCYNAGEIINPQEYAQNGGICGWACIAGIYNCYNTGIVSGGYGVYGQHWGSCTITNAYNNSDICNLPILYNGPHTITGGGNTTTATLCNGTLPEGFSSDDWIPGSTKTTEDGIVYTFPHLKVFEDKYPPYSITKQIPIEISVKSLPQNQYALGETLKPGTIFTFKYKDGTTRDFEDAAYIDDSFDWNVVKKNITYTGFDNTTVGTKTINVKCFEATTSFEVEVVDPGETGFTFLENDGTLKFYYGNYRTGANYIKPDGLSTSYDFDLVLKAVFDESFIKYKPKSCFFWFGYHDNLSEIVDMEKYLNTEDVEDMSYMFASNAIKSLDLSNFDTRKVTNMNMMFCNYSNNSLLETIYVGDNWKTTNVSTYRDMFYGCNHLVGGKGTVCNGANNDYLQYARIDDPEHGKPGYFTYKAPKPENPYTEPEVKNNAYQISSAEDLLYFMFDVNSGNVDANAILTQDIVVNADLFTQISDLLKRTTKAGNALNEWTPIGTAENPFRGTFDGNGHIISGIYIKDATQSNVGLFGNVGSEAVIKNLGVTDSYIAGNENVGAICGKSEGTVVNCYTVSEVKGSKNVNPLVGAKEKAAVVQNSFYLADSPKANDPCAKTAEQFKSGEVAAQLAKGATINGVTYSGESFAGLTELPGTENIELITDPDNPSTAVSAISDKSDVKVWSYNSTIYIVTLPDTKYTIIDLNGRTIKSATTKSTKEEVNLNQSGVFVVVINNKSFKIAL